MGLKIGKFRIPLLESQLPITRRAIAMFPNQNIGNAFFFRLRIINLIAINEHHDIRILFNSPGFPEISQNRDRGFPILDRATELGQRKHGNIQFFCEGLERPADIGNFLLS